MKTQLVSAGNFEKLKQKRWNTKFGSKNVQTTHRVT